MKVLNKIKAILSVAGEKLVFNLKAAEFKKGVAYLHPEENENVTYIVKNKSVDILINNGEDISNDDMIIVTKEQEQKEPASNPSDTPITPQPQKPNHSSSNNHYNKKFGKTKITFTVYADERTLINKMIKESGYNRADYFIACFQNNLKKSVTKSFDAECAKVKKAHDERNNKDI